MVFPTGFATCWAGGAARIAIMFGLAGMGIWSCSGPVSGGIPEGGGALGSSGAGGNAGGASSSGGNPSASGTSGSGGTGSSGAGASSGAAGSSGGLAGSSGSPASSGSSSGASPDAGGNGSSGSSSGGQNPTGVGFGSDRVIVTGVRATTSPPATSVIHLHNGGQTAAQVSSLAITGTDRALFQISSPPVMPATLPPGADLIVTVQLLTTGPTLPPPPSNKDLGSTLLSATLTAVTSAGTVQASVYGLVLIQSNWEPTLGQILTTLGYKLNVGKAQNNWNPNTSMNATNLPGVETGTDEVAAPRFIKAGAGSATMSVVARFSPVGQLAFGWYPATNSSAASRKAVGVMSMIADAQTSDKARMVLPPLASGGTTFDPGAASFGLWVFSDQATQMFHEGGNPVNGDYDFSEDALNSPANVHRFKSYPLKDASGTPIAQNYLVAVEEAGNGDYQDYVFLLSNVNAAP